ncbi:hypothetical protein JCM11641_001255 [Rhodosporidiobolus odoratus]
MERHHQDGKADYRVSAASALHRPSRSKAYRALWNERKHEISGTNVGGEREDAISYDEQRGMTAAPDLKPVLSDAIVQIDTEEAVVPLVITRPSSHIFFADIDAPVKEFKMHNLLPLLFSGLSLVSSPRVGRTEQNEDALEIGVGQVLDLVSENQDRGLQGRIGRRSLVVEREQFLLSTPALPIAPARQPRQVSLNLVEISTFHGLLIILVAVACMMGAFFAPLYLRVDPTEELDEEKWIDLTASPVHVVPRQAIRYYRHPSEVPVRPLPYTMEEVEDLQIGSSDLDLVSDLPFNPVLDASLAKNVVLTTLFTFDLFIWSPPSLYLYRRPTTPPCAAFFTTPAASPASSAKFPLAPQPSTSNQQVYTNTRHGENA